MIVYILAIPVFSFLVPLYAFWHFDDFSWGNTRIVLGERGQKRAVGPEEGTFDPSSIPMKRWTEHENEELWEKESSYCPGSVASSCRYTTASSRGGGRIPSESDIVEEIERILDNHDLMHLTKKQVRDTLSQTFGMDMNIKRDFINKCIEQSLAERL